MIQQLAILGILIVSIILLTMIQGDTSFFYLLPILLVTFLVSWFLYREIQRDHEENLKRGIFYMKEEEDAQHWLKKSFVPKLRRLAKKEMRIIIITSGILLVSFIFLWSYFVSGLMSATINTILGLLFFIAFIIYALYAPKEFTHLFKHVPQRYRHHSKNDWVHGYLLLFPFAAIGFFLYSLTTTGDDIITGLYSTIIFLFSYTLLFIALYCIWFLHKEYQKEAEQSAKKVAKEILKK